MPRFITFNGQTLVKPGALSKVTASPNRRSNPSSTGIVALIGEADGGAAGIHEFTDPSQIQAALGGGDLATAAALVFDPSNDPNIPGGAFKAICYKTNTGVAAAINLPGDEAVVAASTVDAAPTSTVITWVAPALVSSAHIGRWLKLATLSGAQYRRIVSNTTASVTVAPAFLGDPTTFVGLACTILQNQVGLTARQYGTEGNSITAEFEAGATSNKYVFTASNGTVVEQSPEICGDEYLRLEFVGGVTVNYGGINSATSTSVVFKCSAAALINAFAGYVITLPGGLRRKILSHNATVAPLDPMTVVFAAGYELTAAQATASVGGAAYIYAATAGVSSITGASGLATALTSTITQVPAYTLDNLSITFSTVGVTTLKQLVDYINANFNYLATIPDGINPATPLSELDFGTNNTSVVVLYDNGIAATDPKNKGGFRRDLQTLVNWVNSSSSLVSATRASIGTGEGAELPMVTGGLYSTVRDVFVWLVGGSRGTSTNTNWQTGFDALRNYRANGVVAVIAGDLANGSTATWNSVAAQLLVHVNQCNGQYKNERGGFIGFAGTRAQLISKAALFNSKDVQVTGQKFTVLDITGNLTEQAEWSSAAIAAGMRAGGLGESLTRKYPRVTAATQDAGWSPANRDDVNALLMGSVLFAETLPNGVVRWVRDITTYTIDDLETSIDGQTRDVVRYIAYDLRTFVEDTFTGQRVRNGRDGRPPTIASIREMAGARLGTYVDLDLLINSLDPQDPTKTVPGFDRLRVTIDGSALKLTCRIFPTVATAFEELDITTEIPLLSAGA